MTAGQLSTRTRQYKVPMKIIGLTGGVASGKSLASKFFQEEGVPVIDADQLSRELSRKGGAAHEAIVQRFGTADRRKLREIVFADASARKDLEGILHPLIQAEFLKRLGEIADKAVPSGNPLLVVYEAALLVETGLYKDFELLVVVDAAPGVRKKRLIDRDKLSDELAERMLAAQASDKKRLAVANVILNNSGSPEELHKQVKGVIRLALQT